jgi:hypothetical protein
MMQRDKLKLVEHCHVRQTSVCRFSALVPSLELSVLQRTPLVSSFSEARVSLNALMTRRDKLKLVEHARLWSPSFSEGQVSLNALMTRRDKLKLVEHARLCLPPFSEVRVSTKARAMRRDKLEACRTLDLFLFD